jgi:hypothetical protein
VIDAAIAYKEIVANIVSYLPTKHQIKACMLVSTMWKDAVERRYQHTSNPKNDN